MVVFEERFQFGTKAETLERLAPLLTKSEVPRFIRFTVEEWRRGDREEILDRVRHAIGDSDVIVRSSALGEDGAEEALAGAFLSIPNVSSSHPDDLSTAVERVIEDYRKIPASPGDDADHLGHQVIIQQMIQNVRLTGVLFTQDLSTGAPYYVINYDDESGSTESVTAGSAYSNRTLYVFRDTVSQLTSPRFLQILDAVGEIEDLVHSTCLDIEFALGRDSRVHIFQVRRITTQPNWNRGLTLQIRDTLQSLREALLARYTPESEAAGDDLGGAILGNMPDWNPAEMIGTTPKNLAFSLYRTLITDRSWRVARRLMGYRERRGVPLMMSLAGQPYIDVRESFRSYLPAALPSGIGDKLVSAWLERLRHHHHLHDKVEFDVAVTAYTPDFDRSVQEQFPEALTADELNTFRDHLQRLTNDLLKGRVASIGNQIERVELLARRRRKIIGRSPSPSFEMLSELIEDAIDYGTIPFSVLARHGFIATTILRSLVARDVMSQAGVDEFQRSVPTIASELVRDFSRFVNGDLREEDFLERYGHLRPGTYDILSLRYDQRLAGLTTFAPDRRIPDFTDGYELKDAVRSEIDRLLVREGIEVDADALLTYCRAATQAREHAKFVFTHNVSDALEIIAALGARHGLSREELSYISVRDFLDAFVEPRGRSIENHLRSLADQGREAHMVTNAILLPSVIDRLSDLVIVPLAVEQPNFITRKSVQGVVVQLRGADLDPAMVDGKIVAIQGADPGFDFIFSRNILGLITKYGGANSHMAIRCAEFGLPAAIGCGEQIYERVVRAGSVELSCAEGRLRNA
jgi:glutamine kinase